MSPHRREGGDPDDARAALAERFERIAAELSPRALAADVPAEADEEALTDEVLRQLTQKADARFLGSYGRAGMMAALEAYGVMDALRARGYAQFVLRFELEDRRHTLFLDGDGERLVECRMRRVQGATDPCIAELQRHVVPDLLYVEWLQLRDPRADFTVERPRLPGQDHPGTGLGSEVFLLIYQAARRLKLDGILEVPAYFHNAVLYRRNGHFVDPGVEGRFEALLGLLESHCLAEVAWALEEGRVVDVVTEQPVRWLAREHLVPLCEPLAGYFESSAWRRARSAARRSLRLQIRA